ncbi:hypothetical protein Tco_0935138, partial [Tanacetum coccineum]
MLRLLKILRKSMSKLVITIFKTDHNTGIKRILNNLQEVQNAVKGDHALNKKVLEVTTIDYLLATVTAQSDHLAKWAESSALMTWSVSPRMTRIKNTQDNIQSKIASLKIDTSKIKNLAHTATISPTKETPSQTEGEKDDMITKEIVSKTADVEKESEQEPQDTETIPIIIVNPTVTPSEPEIIRSSSRPQLTDPIVEVQVSQPKSSSHTSPKHDRGKCIARDTDESPRKLVKASTDVRLDSNTQERLEKLTNEKELRKKRIDQDRWTTSSRRKPETITDIHIHPNTKLVAITVYKGNDKRTFHVYKPFR